MTYLISFFIVAGTMTQPVLTVHGSQQTCELAKAKLLKDMPKEYKLVASCIDR
ncbi:MAG: hypothetical protein ING36_06885 [Burkholderiales bacterium]|jgi:hypothetical protein|nr:hypothetical protein [Microcystis sp. M020S1]MCA2954544.1 hypothetical protein [Microcystis sp. M010S1]MCA3160587.1 hypothetical protein [Burkholderiales bacterium]MCA3171421.1 hypothetical protein [Burkholderiales bacterium]MCA3173887.1 hypothetical protein [Burkholderiales bacterium]